MSAQLQPITLQQDKLPQELLLTLDKALLTSKHSGWAWSLTRDNRRVCSGSGMFGYPASQLTHMMESHPQATALYLSAPLHSGFITLDELLPSLKAAGIREINLPSIDNAWWIFGKAEDKSFDSGIVINYFPINHIASQVYYGPYTVKTKSRPWITCITATNMRGGHVDMQIFNNDFGFKQRIRQSVMSSHAVITDGSVSSKAYQGLRNSAGCELLLHEYKDEASLRAFLANLAQMQLSTAVVIANYNTCMQLQQSGLVDEFLLSYQLLDSPHIEPIHSTPSTIANLAEWTVVDSHLLSLGVQVELIKKPF
jgi:hypothetical protein